MTITTCPKCGSMNITTAGTCANCGWSQFAQVTVSSGEIEIKVTGKALLDDYKQLLFENNALTARIAELETLVNELIKAGLALTRVAEWRYTNLPELLAWDTLVENIYKEREE